MSAGASPACSWPAAAELRSRLERFVEDWDSPEMTAYDHYDAAKALL